MNCVLPVITGLAIGADTCLAGGLLEEERATEHFHEHQLQQSPEPQGFLSGSFLVSIIAQAANLALINNCLADMGALTIFAALITADMLCQWLAGYLGQSVGLARIQQWSKRLLIGASWMLAGYLLWSAPLFGVGMALQLAIKALKCKLPAAFVTWSARLGRIAGAIISWNIMDVLGKTIAVVDVLCTTGLIWYLPSPAAKHNYLQQQASQATQPPVPTEAAPALSTLADEWSAFLGRFGRFDEYYQFYAKCFRTSQEEFIPVLFEKLQALEQRVQHGDWDYIYNIDSEAKGLWNGIKHWATPHELDEMAAEHQLRALCELAYASDSCTSGVFSALRECYAELSSCKNLDSALQNFFRLLRTQQLFWLPSIMGILSPLGFSACKSVSTAQAIAARTPNLDSCFISPAHYRQQAPLYGLMWVANACALRQMHQQTMDPELLSGLLKGFLESPLGKYLWGREHFMIATQQDLKRALVLLQTTTA